MGVMVFTNGQTAASTVVNGSPIPSMATVTTLAKMDENSVACGRALLSMVAASILGQMDERSVASTPMTRKRDLVFLHGEMAGASMDGGIRASSTATALRTGRLARSSRKASGSWADRQRHQSWC